MTDSPVKNYLVGAVRPVIKSWSWEAGHLDNDNPNPAENLRHYQKMYDISRAGARKFLKGDWEGVLFSAPVLDARMFQIAQWYHIKELWFREPCNILAATADVMFVNTVEIFGTFPHMMLFNYTDPKSHADLKIYLDGAGHYFNDAVVYYPSTMDAKVWELGERHMRDWFHHAQAHWDCGQLINNHMYWSQDIPADQRLYPTLNFSAHSLRTTDAAVIEHHERWNNGVAFDAAQIVHFAGSRGASDTLAVMQQLAEMKGIPHD